VIPRRHGADGLALHQPEWNAVVELLMRREQLSAQDATIRGWNVGLNSGEAAGQTVFHSHWYLIPRRTGDDKSPRGCVRGVIKGKQQNSSTEPWPKRRRREKTLSRYINEFFPGST